MTLTNGFDPQVGDLFDLFDFASTNGMTFASIDLPELIGAMWDVSDLYVGGSIAVVIPEPATLALMAMGVADSSCGARWHGGRNAWRRHSEPGASGGARANA